MVGRVSFPDLIWPVLLCGAMLSPLSLAKNQADVSDASNKPDPDVLLINVYKDLAANHLNAALLKADALVAAYPNFRLGHLIRGDLLLMHARPVTSLGGASNAPADKLKDLRDEAAVRLKSLSRKPDADMIPRALLQLREDQKYVLLVDAKQSRLYVYQHQNGHFKFMTDYYVSQGKLGVNKLKAGDQKTPLGVYYITSRLARARLPDFYGAGALPINYPNDWDKLNGRSGSGIWLHGTPSDSYSRPPLASDGCVVLTNPDIEKLALSVEVGKTPVVISDQLEFVNQTKWDAEHNAALKMIDTWRRDVESMDAARVSNNYSRQFKSGPGEDLNAWLRRNKQPSGDRNALAIQIRDLTLFRYPGQGDMIVGTFTQEAVIGKVKSIVRKRQYWVREGIQWKIIYEANI